MSFTLCVMLWAVDGRHDDLAAYEDDVLALLGRHGARLVARVQNTEAADGRPYEVQIIDVPSEARWRRTWRTRIGSPWGHGGRPASPGRRSSAPDMLRPWSHDRSDLSPGTSTNRRIRPGYLALITSSLARLVVRC
jgi:hypothetical protein